uniref:TOG domain-containing protein n=1 Tax=Plectus sambesii TaxID=2011161 RepID=A0A914UJU1_9BILA
MEGLVEFQDLMARMLSPENESRSAAEKQYEAIAVPHRASLLFLLFQQANADVEARSMCLVLLRRLLTQEWENLWREWGKEVQDQFCDQLLKCGAQEPTALLRKRLADVIAEVARNTIDEETGRQTWQGVIKFVEMCATANDAPLRETGMILIENVPGIFGVDQMQYMPGIKSMFQSSLTFAADGNVRTAAVRAYVAFLCDNDEDESVIRSLSVMIPAVLKVCEHVVTAEDDDDIPLQCLGDLATSVPKILRPHIAEIANLCLATVANKEKDDSFRHSALEVMVSLCESSAAMVRKQGAQFIPSIVEQCLGLMTELEDDDEDWYTADTVDADEDDDNASVGETSLDRVACALGGKVTLPPALQLIPQLVSSDNWKARHAGIMAISTMGEGCKRAMEPRIEEIVDSIIPFLNDPHPRVRYAACNALGQMSSDFAPTLQKRCHQKVVPALLSLLDKLEHPRVAAHAGAAMVNFSEECPKAIITVYLSDMMAKLEWVLEQTFKALLEKGKKLVLEQIITTIASVADAAQEQFINFYDRLMGPLKYILQNANHENLRLLRGKTIECISLIGLAVGKEKFLADANEIMQMLLASQAQFGNMDADDPQVSYMISAWARICKLLGDQFAPYLPLVMPPVMKSAEFKPEVTVMSEEDAAEQQADPDWNFISLGDQQTFGIRTAGLEDKATACEMLVCYARELKGAFADYVEPVTQLMIPLLKFYFHDGVRSAAAECLPCLLECGAPKGAEFVRQMWTTMFPALLDAIQSEHDLEVVADDLHALAQCVEVLGTGALSAEQITTVTELLSAELKKHDERFHARDKLRSDDDHDEEQEAELKEQIEFENGVLARSSDVIHALFQTYRDQFLPYFERLEPQFTALLDVKRNYGDRQWSICVFDDVIEYGGPNSVKYQQSFYRPMIAALADTPMIAALADTYPEVRQAAAYGFGVMAMHGGNAYAQACAGALDPLASLINREDARSTSESVSATENAISAVGKILKYNSSMVDASQVIPAFLSWLPVWEDKEECPHVYGFLCDLIEGNNPMALGENNANLPHVLKIIVEAFHRDAFEEDKSGTKERLINIVRHIQSNEEMFRAVVAAADLSSEQQLALHNMLSA